MLARSGRSRRRNGFRLLARTSRWTNCLTASRVIFFSGTEQLVELVEIEVLEKISHM